jgi:hypothetical protein
MHLKTGTGWYVLVTWPEGQTEQVSGFFTERQAIDWIADKSDSWRSGVRK